MLEKILIGLFTGLVGLWTGHRLRLVGDAKAKRERFRSFIRQTRAVIESLPDFELAFSNPAVFPASVKRIPQLERELIEVEYYIRARKRRAFADAASHYRAIEQEIGDQKRSAEVKSALLAALDEILRAAK